MSISDDFKIKHIFILIDFSTLILFFLSLKTLQKTLTKKVNLIVKKTSNAYVITQKLKEYCNLSII